MLSSFIDVSQVYAFLAAFSLIIMSELGDRTFFIAAILAMNQSRLAVFLGAMTANSLMVFITVLLGYLMTVIPHGYIRIISAVLFAIFGFKMIKEGWLMDPEEGQEEYQEAEEKIQKKKNQEEKHIQKSFDNSVWSLVTSSVFTKTFSLTFLAEWGDRSQIATILLGASQDIAGIVFGTLLGHTLCTGFAVVCGHLVAKQISLPKVHICSGLIFIGFAVSALWMDSHDD